MDNTLNNLIFLFYILTAFSIWGTMTLRKKYLVLSLTTWLFWIIAIIGHSYALTFILNDEFKVNLSVNYALTLVAFIISATLYISSAFSNTKFLGIIVLPVISAVFLFDLSNKMVNVSLDSFLFIHVIISLISYSILCL